MWCVGHVVLRFQVGPPATSLRPCVSCRRPTISYDSLTGLDAGALGKDALLPGLEPGSEGEFTAGSLGFDLPPKRLGMGGGP